MNKNMMPERLTFQHLPYGASGGRAPEAPSAAARTSCELVRDGEADAAFFRMLEAGGIRLNAPQIAAVRHGEGPMLTLAGAGSGKTSVLICRTAYLLAERRVSPDRVLLLTFSSRAAAEMRDRIAALPAVERQDAARLQARTFHSFFLYFLRRMGVQDDIFAETRRQHILLKEIMRTMGLQRDAHPPETLLSLLSHAKMNLGGVDAMPEGTESEAEIKRILITYERWKSDNRKIDFDDVLLIAHRMLKEQPSLLYRLQQQYHYLMVDEFQDTNALQYELVRMVAEPHNNLMVVGDDDQTIYSFNGARSEFILEFEKWYPGAGVVTLDINYRSGPSIIGLGNGIIRHNRRRRTKTLQAHRSEGPLPRYMRPENADEEAEHFAAYMMQEVQSGRRSYRDFAVLYRTTSSNRALVETLLLADIPFVDYGEGQLLYDHWLIAPVIGYLRLSADRRDFEAMERIVPTLYLNRERGMNHINDMEQHSPKRGPLVHLLTLPGLEPYQTAKISDRLELIRGLTTLSPLRAIKQIRSSFYDDFIEAGERRQATLHRETLKEMLDELESSAGRFGTIPAFLQFIGEIERKSLEGGGKAGRKSGQGREDEVQLMTIHKSKGLEFPVVLLAGASEGLLPHSSALEELRAETGGRYGTLSAGAPRKGQPSSGWPDSAAVPAAALEEERRLAYVAVTRAREELIVSSPALLRGRKAAVSRFLLAAFRTAEGGSGSGPGGPRAAHVRRGAESRGAADGGRRDRTARIGAPEFRPPAARTRTVAVWSCPAAGCPGWMRVKAGGAEDALEAKPCPLCASAMTKGTREVPV